jgi:fused signal recognition particle receptor
MSSFNWFNREVSEPSSEQKESAQESVKEASESQAEDAPASADDYLNWAKAAYQNIQKRKQADAEEAAAKPNTTSKTEPAEGAEDSPETSEPVAADVLGVEVGEAETTETPQPETLAVDKEPTAEEGAEPSPVVPLWARADAERQERLERLKAEAEAEAIAEAASPGAGATPASPVAPAAELDENFLWSARVLANQGRRADTVDVEEINWLARLRQGLDKTRRSLVNQLRAIVGQGPLNADAVMEIEALLLQADVGVEATDYIIASLQDKLRQEALPPEEAIAYLKSILRNMLDNPGGQPVAPSFTPEKDRLNIWLMTGVNGAGKTTTIGKIAHLGTKSGYKCLIGAADTFRAAAVEQVKIWGARSEVEVIANPGKNTDPAAVVFDAIGAAQSRDTELLLIDTAGRLQNKKNLMDELTKVRRIIDKKAPDANVEALLVLDATLGQNGVRQAEVFSEAVNLSGVILTKLDGTAKGGVALAVVQQLGLPIRFIGAGEGIEDLRPFSSYEFVEALLSG